ncbi:hypothetical protein TWF506_003959 [Arthrobotrys conoides]|uniref:Aminoglycoside phosphotransferase domain-containing protein n=1 Tax=Arthrobotrys conoides TaxID=74498 RepID=A0AAN8NAQ0_9PEZI
MASHVGDTSETSIEPDEEAIRTCSKEELPKLIDKLWGKYNFEPKQKPPQDGLQIHFRQKRIPPNFTSRLVWTFCRRRFLTDLIAAVNLARSLGIRTPPIERAEKIILDGRQYYLLIIPYIPGESLQNLLPRIDRQETIRLAFQLRDMLETMHKKTNKYAGGIETLGFDARGKFRRRDEVGLPTGSTTGRDIARIVNFWWGHRRETHGESRMTAEKMEWDIKNGPLTPKLPLVFTHYDLRPCNLVRDNKGDLWIIRWGHAGWYPACFDRASMMSREFKDKMVDQRWKLFVSIANSYEWLIESKAVERMERRPSFSSNDRMWSARLGLTKSQYPLLINKWPSEQVRYRPV